MTSNILRQLSEKEIDDYVHNKPDHILDYAFQVQKSGNTDFAESIYKKLLALYPKKDAALHLMGIIGFQKGDYKRSIRYIKQALEIAEPKSYYHNDIGASYYAEGMLEQAIFHYRRSIELNEKAETYSNLGEAIKGKGEIEKAMECYQKALELKPDFTPAFSNLLLNSNYSTSLSPKEIFDFHKKWGDTFANHLSNEKKEFENDLVKNKRLKIGYISPDFCDHSVAWFMKNLVLHHDRQNFEVYCYSNVQMPDQITEYFIQHADHWLNLTPLNHDTAAKFIESDQIDILFDLTGHTVSNRLLTVAKRPAPIQFSYLGYPNTFGVQAIDYRIVDNHTDPEGLTDDFNVETLLRLPHSFLCYSPPEHAPPNTYIPRFKKWLDYLRLLQ